MAGPTITFDTNASDKDVARYFQTAEAFLFPALDDFGMVAVEALSAGAPVIAFKIGGSSDYVQPGVTGLLFGEQTAESLVKTLQDFPKYRFDHAAISKSAEAFSVQIFKNHINAFVKKHLDI